MLAWVLVIKPESVVNRRICDDVCQGRHPTIMHTEEARVGDPHNQYSLGYHLCCQQLPVSAHLIKSSMVVPVYISHTDDPSTERVIYAMLDTQSDSSFITEETAAGLGVEGKKVRLSLSTMTSKDQIINCKRFEGLQVRGFNSQHRIKLPGMYSRTTIPINRDHIPCPGDAGGLAIPTKTENTNSCPKVPVKSGS